MCEMDVFVWWCCMNAKLRACFCEWMRYTRKYGNLQLNLVSNIFKTTLDITVQWHKHKKYVTFFLTENWQHDFWGGIPLPLSFFFAVPFEWILVKKLLLCKGHIEMIENSLFLSFGENFVIVNIVSLHFPSFLFVSVSFGDGHYQKI